jgi:hypothetical protein
MPRENDRHAILDLREFIKSIECTKRAEYHDARESKVPHEGEFERMRDYLLDRYRGIESDHYFVDDGGQIFDCVQRKDHPCGQGMAAQPEPPPDIVAEIGAKNGEPLALPPLSPGKKDRFGREMFYEAGTLPLRRVGLLELTRFETLDNYFLKSPVDPSQHRYAHVLQKVANLGAASEIDICRPKVTWSPNAPGRGEVFSLSQIWCTAGHQREVQVIDGRTLQTVEVGWHVFPMRYSSLHEADLLVPRLFVYWTADGYYRGPGGRGSYNCDRQWTFTLAERSPWHPGIALTSPGRLKIEVRLVDQEWRILVQDVYMGHYKCAIFQPGPLASKADMVDFGGETCAWDPTFPPMGSGRRPSGRPSQDYNEGVAYQRNLWYWALDGRRYRAEHIQASEPSPLYNIRPHDGMPNDAWGQSIFFGGPGGYDPARYSPAISPLGPGS